MWRRCLCNYCYNQAAMYAVLVITSDERVWMFMRARRKKDTRTGKRRNLATFNSKAAAKKHERAVQYFKHH